METKELDRMSKPTLEREEGEIIEDLLAGRTVVNQGETNLVTFSNGYSYHVNKGVTLTPSQEILMQMRTRSWGALVPRAEAKSK